jgi:hypothetical protein
MPYQVAVLYFVNLLFAGLLAGVEIAIHYGVCAAAEVLSDQSQLLFRRALVLKLRVLVPALFVPTAVSGIAIAVLDSTSAGFWFHFVGMLAVVIWIATRVIATVRINKAMLTWEVEAPPKNWKAQVDHAERFHIVGVWAAALAFAFFLTAAVLDLAAH